MKVDIWSDVICPYCYIGKRKFEMALQQFPHKAKIEIEWHSFELDPRSKPEAGTNVYDYLAERKGQSREWAEHVHEQVTQAALQVGLVYNFDQAIVANTFDAHRLIQLAKNSNLGDIAEERLFKAYFTEGKNIADHGTLIDLGKEIGLKEPAIREMFLSKAMEEEVRNDEANAQILGIRGVPFFVLNNKYGISGAQAPEMFLQALHKAWSEFEKVNSITKLGSDGADACSMEGEC